MSLSGGGGSDTVRVPETELAEAVMEVTVAQATAEDSGLPETEDSGLPETEDSGVPETEDWGDGGGDNDNEVEVAVAAAAAAAAAAVQLRWAGWGTHMDWCDANGH